MWRHWAAMSRMRCPQPMEPSPCWRWMRRLRSLAQRDCAVLPFGELFLGPGKSALKHGEELLVGFYIKDSDMRKTASCFKRIMRPQGVALPIINLPVWLEREGDCIQDMHIAVGPGSARLFVPLC